MITSTRPEPWQITRQAFLATHPRLKAARTRMQDTFQALGHGQGTIWGDTTRFAGKMAGNRLDRAHHAEAVWSRLYDRLAAAHLKAVQRALAGGLPVPAEVAAEYQAEIRRQARRQQR